VLFAKDVGQVRRCVLAFMEEFAVPSMGPICDVIGEAATSKGCDG